MVTPYLSIVLAARSEQEAKDFVHYAIEQLRRFELESEILVVIWNPLPQNADSVHWPDSQGWCNLRIIEIPQSIPHAFIAKNVGIRRARGTFILSTTSTTRFSDELIHWISMRSLNGTHVYTSPLKSESHLQEVPNLAKNILPWTLPTIFRNSRLLEMKKAVEEKLGRTVSYSLIKRVEKYLKKTGHRFDLQNAVDEISGYCVEVGAQRGIPCDHFLLMSQKKFHWVKGTPELGVDPRYLDTLTLCAAVRKGMLQVNLGRPFICSSVGPSEKPTEEGANNNVPRLTHGKARKLAFDLFRMGGNFINDDNWGMGNVSLKEKNPGPMLQPHFNISYLTQFQSNNAYQVENSFPPRFRIVGDIPLSGVLFSIHQGLDTSTGPVSVRVSAKVLTGQLKVFGLLPDMTAHFSKSFSTKDKSFIYEFSFDSKTHPLIGIGFTNLNLNQGVVFEVNQVRLSVPPTPVVTTILDEIFQRFNIRTRELLHVGAHHGQEAEDYARLQVPKVCWIEGNPDSMPKLCAHVSQFSRQNVIQALVTDKDGENKTLHVTNFEGMSSSIFDFGTHSLHAPNYVFVEEKSLPTVTLDTLARQLNLDPDFLCLDIQGAELLALKGAEKMLENIRYIFTEVSTDNVYKGGALMHELDAFLNERNFTRVMTNLDMLAGTHGNAFYIKRDQNLHI